MKKMEKMDIVHEFETNVSVKEVYNALSTANGIHGWWSKECVYPDSVGENVVVRFNERGVEMQFRIEELIPDQSVKWECVACPNPSFPGTKIDFEIAKSDNGALFKFNHHGWDEQWRGTVNYEQSAETWKHFMESLKAYLETGKGMPW